MNPTARRVLTAVILLAIFLPAILWASAGLWQGLIAIVVALAAFEWARLSAFPLMSARLYAGLLAVIAWSLPVVLGAVIGTLQQVANQEISAFEARMKEDRSFKE